MKYLLSFLLLLGSIDAMAVPLSSLVSHNQPIIIADKRAGLIYVYDSSILHSAPALYGLQVADSIVLGITPFATPAGEFLSHKMYSTYLNSFITSFYEDTNSILAIHPVWLKNPKQKRLQRLNSPTSADNRITNGCINVPSDFYFSVISKLPDKTKIVILPEQISLEPDTIVKNELDFLLQ